MINTVALIINGKVQLNSNNNPKHTLNISELELKKDTFWIAYDDIEENYIVSNKTKNIINRVKNLESILEIISLKLPTNKHLS